MKKIIWFIIISAFFLSPSFAADKKAISPVILSPIEKDKQTIVFTNKYEIKTIQHAVGDPLIILLNTETGHTWWLVKYHDDKTGSKMPIAWKAIFVDSALSLKGTFDLYDETFYVLSPEDAKEVLKNKDKADGQDMIRGIFLKVGPGKQKQGGNP